MLAGVSAFGFGGTNSFVLMQHTGGSMLERMPCTKLNYHHIPYTWWEKTIRAATAPLLGTKSFLENGSGLSVVWQQAWPTATCAWMSDHRVGQTPLVPGTLYLYMALNVLGVADGASAQIDTAQFVAMFFLDSLAPLVRVSMNSGNTILTVNIESKTATGEWIQHALVAAAPLVTTTNGATNDDCKYADKVSQPDLNVCISNFNIYTDTLLIQTVIQTRCWLDWFVKPDVSSLVKAKFLQNGQLEAMRVKLHMYQTRWECLSIVDGANCDGKVSTSLHFDQSNDWMLLASASDHVSETEELCVALHTGKWATHSCCFHLGQPKSVVSG